MVRFPVSEEIDDVVLHNMNLVKLKTLLYSGAALLPIHTDKMPSDHRVTKSKIMSGTQIWLFMEISRFSFLRLIVCHQMSGFSQILSGTFWNSV